RARRSLNASRPTHFFRANGPMPERVSIQLQVPAELGDPAELGAELEAMVQKIEQQAAAERLRDGTRVIGRAGVMKQSWRTLPETFEKRRQMSPRIAARNMWARIEALTRNGIFVRAY